jgi:probable rRNA maturation factor
MSQLPIHFFSEEISFTIKDKGLLRAWIKNTIIEEGFKLRELNFIFCSDNYLLSMNQQYLKHDTYTDIITFDNSEKKGEIVGDIFISLERIQENAQGFKVKTEDELHRVMIHGTLHLMGYADKGKEAKALMTDKENLYLSKRAF